jgi:hypothetical protein
LGVFLRFLRTSAPSALRGLAIARAFSRPFGS